MWETGDDGGYPISSFQIRYRQQNESEEQWKTCQPDFISPDKVSNIYGSLYFLLIRTIGPYRLKMFILAY